jgi:hypothetical protein
MAVPLACIALWPNDREHAHDAGAPPLLPALLAASVPLAGTAIFCLYLQVRFGDALAWVHGQAAWGLPLLGRWPAPDPIPIQSDLEVRSTEWIVYAGNVAAFAAAVAAIRPVTRRFGLAYGLWIAVNIFPPLAGHLFLSMGRFVSVLFPVFLWLAARIPAPRLWPVAGTLGAAQALFAVWFFLWRAVF